MSKNCTIMQRMKENYESRSRTFLIRRTPVIIRLDGKAFHTYTKGMDKPFDEGMIEDMLLTTIYLCENIQGAKVGYCQSDEISILLTDYDRLTSQAWFDYNLQKITSVSASMASSYFNLMRYRRYYKGLSLAETYQELEGLSEDKGLAQFDSRAFNLPKEEVSNYFLARQNDAVKNSISMLAQSLYSHKELNKKNQADMQELCFLKGHNWNDLHYSKKRGSTVTKNLYINDKLAFTGHDDHGKSIWYQPNNIDGLYPDARGRALEWGETDIGDGHEDWCDIPIEKIRSKWESVETPMKFNEEFFKHKTK